MAPSSRDAVIPDVPWATPAIPEILTTSSATGETSEWYEGASYHRVDGIPTLNKQTNKNLTLLFVCLCQVIKSKIIMSIMHVLGS